MTLILRLNTDVMINSGDPAQVAAAEAVAPVTGHNLDGSDIRDHRDVLWEPDLEIIVDLGDMPNGQQVAVLNGVRILTNQLRSKIAALQADIDIIKAYLGA